MPAKGMAAVTGIDPELLALIPEPFLTVKPGDTVTLFTPHLDFGIAEPSVHLAESLRRVAPDVIWCVVEGAGITTIIHVAREDRTPRS